MIRACIVSFTRNLREIQAKKVYMMLVINNFQDAFFRDHKNLKLNEDTS